MITSVENRWDPDTLLQPKKLDVHLVMDNYGTRNTPTVNVGSRAIRASTCTSLQPGNGLRAERDSRTARGEEQKYTQFSAMIAKFDVKSLHALTLHQE